jgi:hypothetical protein
MSDAMPKVKVYPLCSECRAPYVLRQGIRISTGKTGWFWQRDCKHKKAVPLNSVSQRVANTHAAGKLR